MTDLTQSDCGDAQFACVCDLPSGHEGAHHCACGGEWYYDEDGNFKVKAFPSVPQPGSLAALLGMDDVPRIGNAGGIVTPRDLSDSELRDIALELEALERIREVQDGGEFAGRCPNWEIPAHIPVQRLQGLKRRRLLNYDDGRWWLTELGRRRAEALAEVES